MPFMVHVIRQLAGVQFGALMVVFEPLTAPEARAVDARRLEAATREATSVRTRRPPRATEGRIFCLTFNRILLPTFLALSSR
jgi:hypothetical protein